MREPPGFPYGIEEITQLIANIEFSSRWESSLMSYHSGSYEDPPASAQWRPSDEKRLEMREISLRSAMIEAVHARPWKEECGCQ